MRRSRQADFWRPAWARWIAECAETGQTPTPADDMAPLAWAGALDQARGGDWAWLDELRERVELPDPFAPPPSLWPVLDAFFADPPRRRKGKKPRVDRYVAASIRTDFAMFTRPYVRVDDSGRLTIERAMSATRAREELKYKYHLSEETIRDIVERRKTYSGDP